MCETKEQRHIYYDRDLDVEVYRLNGIVQNFPNHFHEYYVVGFIEGGSRHLWCKGQAYDLAPGDLILFNPRDNHFCAPINEEILDYRAVNIKTEVMRKVAREITGRGFIPHFTQNVVKQSDAAQWVAALYDAILTHAPELKKEEIFFFLLEQILQEYASPSQENSTLLPNEQIIKLCNYMENHFSENITLDDLLSKTSFGKSYLLRLFTKQVGVSPYRYLQTVRLDRAKKMLEQGIHPLDTAVLAGFADQSHFTNYFKEFIGVTPKQYQKIFNDTSVSTTVEKECPDDK